MVFRDVTNAIALRTVVSSILPPVAVGHKAPLIISSHNVSYTCCLLSCLNSFFLDYIARQSIGGNSLGYFIIKQLPIFKPQKFNELCPWNNKYRIYDWIVPYVLEFTYNACDVEMFAKNCGYNGKPFKWSNNRRFIMRCELDATYFHLYEIKRNDVDYILETFPIVRSNDEQKYGDYRTKLTILEIYDKMQEAIDTGKHYQTILDPPPADPSCAHP